MSTVLLIHADGTNGSTAIVEETGKPITVGGNAQISTAQSKFGGSSIAFDGSGDYLSLADSADWHWDGDFTLEMWLYPTNLSPSAAYAILSQSSSGSNEVALAIDTAGKLYLRKEVSGSGTNVTSTNALTLNAWQHIAVVRIGSTVTFYKDGVANGSGTWTGNTDQTSGLYVGGYWYNGAFLSDRYYYGYIDEIRINKGEALYTANFTPPPQPFFYQDTVLLLHCDGTNGSTTFRDETGKTVTASGNAQISTAQSKFGGSSLLLDGTGDYLSVTGPSFGSGELTVEAWVYITTSAATFIVFDSRPSDATTTGFAVYVNSSQKLTFGTGSPFASTSGATTVTTNTWHHIALVRYRNTVYGYLNGVQEFSVSNSATLSNTGWRIGHLWSGTGTLAAGYIDELRVCTAAKYAAAFTPPTAAHDYEYTTLLIHADGNNGQVCVRDETGKAVTVANNATISTTQSKFGGSALSLDGVNDYLSLADSSDWSFGTGDFTIECWIRPGTVSVDQEIISQCGPLTPNDFFIVRLTSAAKIRAVAVVGGVTVTDRTGTTSLSANTWYHIAIVRNAGSVEIYVDGVANASGGTNGAGAWPNSSDRLVIGSDDDGSNDYSGYLDEIRITKGKARYTSGFTPPNVAFSLLGQYTYTISGLVRDDSGSFVIRTVRLYRRDTGALVAETSSNGTTGVFTFSNPEDREYYVVALDDVSGTQYNALIYDKVTRG